MKSGAKRDEHLMTLNYSESPADGVLHNGARSTMSFAPTTVVPLVSPLLQPVTGDLPSGMNNTPPSEDITITLPSPLELFVEDPDLKMVGKDLRSQQPFHQQSSLGLYNLEDNFSRLEASIADLNSSMPSVDSLIGGGDPTLFPIKNEDFSPVGKGEMDLEQDPFGKDVDVSNPKLFGENTMDLLQEFDLPESPTDFYVGDDEFPPLVDDSLLGVIVSDKDSKLVDSLNLSITTANTNKVNGATSSAPSAVSTSSPALVVKQEKESMIQLCTPGVIKQENVSGRSFCQMTSDLSNPVRNVSISICGVSTSSGQSYHFGSPVSSGNLQKDQKPVFNVYTPHPPADEWGRGFGNTSAMQQRASNSCTAAQCFSANYTR